IARQRALHPPDAVRAGSQPRTARTDRRVLMSTEPIGTRPYPVAISEEEWRERLSPAEHQVLRQGGTERPGTGEYEEVRPAGTYAWRAGGAGPVAAPTPVAAPCGWPSSGAPTGSGSVELLEDTALGMRRIGVRCASCGSHLGHVFEGEGFATPTDQRY